MRISDWSSDVCSSDLFAEQMEASSNRLETQIFGRDQGVRGLLRVTLAPTLATHLLMPDFAEFARLHPDIEMEILSSEERRVAPHSPRPRPPPRPPPPPTPHPHPPPPPPPPPPP